MIGPNGAGKTALLEVLVLLQCAAGKQLASRLEALGGAQAIMSRTTDRPVLLRVSLTVDVESKQSSELMNYRFELSPRGTGYAFPFERLEWKWDPYADKSFRYIDVRYEQIHYTDPETHRMVSPTWAYDVLELALAQVPQMYAEPESLRGLLANSQFYSFLDVSQRAVVRLPQLLTPAKRPAHNGEYLYSALYNLRASDPDTYGQIDELLHLGFPGFLRLEFPVVGAGQVTMTWDQKGITGPLYPNELSEGTLRFLWLITVLLSPDTPALTLIDEPEVSLHPELLKLLAGVLQNAALRGQVLVATHSPDLIRWLKPEQVLITEKNDLGATQFTWADSLNLQAWLEEYTLRDLWLMGTLGGRP
jgi:predicted ATPase